jgi:Xaa-Pro aminopeptidase
MRRGLISWSEEEVPRSVLDARVARCQEAMAANNMDVLLVYSNFPRPAAVSYLANFVPYWSQLVLVVLPEGIPTMFVSFSKRVADWIENTAHVADTVCTPNIGGEVAKLLMNVGGIKTAGVVELDRMPSMIINNFRKENDAIEFVDATEMFAGIRILADPTEIALVRRATEIAHTALDLAAPGEAPVEAGILAAIETSARMQGCEEILIDIAEDLSVDENFRRLDGPSVFKNRYAVRLSLAYKGHWVRVGRTFEQDNNGVDRQAAVESYLQSSLANLCDDPLADFDASDRVIEGCVGTAPLKTLSQIATGQIVSVTQRWRDEHGSWLISEPVLLGATTGDPAETLVVL